jgi:predicted nucleotidyltransferase
MGSRQVAAIPRRRVPDYNHRTRIPAWAIRDAVDRIAARYKPLKIILFGSYARGDFSRDSDVDLFILTQKRRRRDLRTRIRRYVEFGFPVDLVVTHEARLNRRLELGDFFLRDIMAEGRILYEAPDGGSGSGRPKRITPGPPPSTEGVRRHYRTSPAFCVNSLPRSI